ncbi:hypothetical protein B7494_g4765 [Chlorociboria aeruginascens]|nr:hypothetical protein B7494_g4765 [Chlorociboria aeruginascens]
MDVAYNQHSPHMRRHDRSSTNLNHLTLAPLTSKFPISDPEYLPETSHTSYIEGRSAPTTPSILSRSSSRVSLRKPKDYNLSVKTSKSSSHLTHHPRTAPTTPGPSKLRHLAGEDDGHYSAHPTYYANDSDWLLRAGALISTSARESKGQAWLVSRASSTSLQRDEDEEALERELAREREIDSRRGSNAAAFDADDEFSPMTTRRSVSSGPAGVSSSRPRSWVGSRGNSRRGSRAALVTPLAGEREREGYFDQRDFAHEHAFVSEPDFVDAEEEAVEDEEDAKNDDAVVRKLAKAGSLGFGGLVEKMLGWSLFAVDEDGEETEVENSAERTGDSELSPVPSRRQIRGVDTPADEKMPPLNPDEAGGWQDAAWLLTVASKVLL